MFDWLYPTSLLGVLRLVAVASTLVICYYGILALLWLRKMKNIGKVVDRLPGPPKHWLYGNLHEHPGPTDAGMEWLLGFVQEHDRAVRMWYGPRPAVMVYHPDTVKAILRTTQPKPVSLGGGYSLFLEWLGRDSLLLGSGKSWYSKRKLLNPTFNSEALKHYMDIYNEAADVLVEKLAATVDAGSINICPHANLWSFDVLLRSIFSKDLDVQRQGNAIPYVNAVLNMAEMATDRFFTPLLFLDIIYYRTGAGRKFKKLMKLVHEVSEDFIAKRRNEYEEGSGRDERQYMDFLDVLMLAKDDEGKGLTDMEIRNQVDTFLFAGHDSTAAALMWTLYELSRHPDDLKKCQREIDSLMGDTSARTDVKWEHLGQLTYTTMCLKEAMRIHPPVPIIQRETGQDLELDGVTLPPDTFVDIFIYLLHHNEAVWGPDHWEFKPERFHPDRLGEMDPFAFLPFGAGPRNCLGQHFAMHELRVVLAKILHKFNLTVDDRHPIEHITCTVMKAKNGIKISVSDRISIYY